MDFASIEHPREDPTGSHEAYRVSVFVSVGRLFVSTSKHTGKDTLMQLWINNDECVGTVTEERNWGEAMALLGEYATAKHGHRFRGHWNNYTQRLALCMDALAADYGLDSIPAPTDENTTETEMKMILHLQPKGWLYSVPKMNEMLPSTMPILAHTTFVDPDCLTAPGRFVLVDRAIIREKPRYVVWWQNAQDGGCSSGGYHHELSGALHDMATRIKQDERYRQSDRQRAD